MPTNNNYTYGPTPLPGTVTVPVLGNNIDRSPGAVEPGVGLGIVPAVPGPVLPITEQPVINPPIPSTRTAEVVLPVAESTVDSQLLTPEGVSGPNISAANQQRYITILANGAVITNNATTLDFEGNGFVISSLGTTGATITINPSAGGYGNTNVVSLLAGFGSTVLSTTGNVTAGRVSATGKVTGNYILGNGSQLTGLAANYGNANVVANLAALGTNPVSTTGNITGGNVNTGIVTLTNGAVIRDTAGNAIAIGQGAGEYPAQGAGAVAVGFNAGNYLQSNSAVAVGNGAGGYTQGTGAVASGWNAGNYLQGNSAVAIGNNAGYTGQGRVAVAIGAGAGVTNQGNNSIIINATGANLDQTTANTFTVAPVRNDVSNTANVMFYNAITKEVTYGNVISVAGNISSSNLLVSGGIFAFGGASPAPSMSGFGTISTTGASGNISASGNLLSGGYASATGNITGGNILTAGIISATGNIFAGNAVFSGNLSVAGNVTYINSNVVTINDLAINLANNAANVTQINGGGIELGPQGTPYVTFLYNTAANTFTSNVGLSAVANITGGNILTAGIMSSTGNAVHGNISTAGTISATGNIITGTNGFIGVGTAAPDTEVTILGNPQTVSYPLTGNSTTAGTDLHITGADGAVTRITQDTFGTGSYVAFTGRAGRGTAASPSATLSGDTLAQFTARGFSSGTLQFGNTSTGRVDVVAAENFTDTARGTNVQIYTTAAGAITPTAVATFSSASGLSVAGNVAAGNVSVTGNITGNTNGFTIGYLNIPQVSLASNVSTTVTDAGKHYYTTSASNLTLTVANNTSVSWAVGTAISVINRGTANVTIAQDTGVSLYLAGNATSGNRVVTTYGMATLINTAANVWMISGTVV
jgi:hypothetical protein